MRPDHQAVRGWVVTPNRGIHMFQAHSVVRRSDGSLIGVTPGQQHRMGLGPSRDGQRARESDGELRAMVPPAAERFTGGAIPPAPARWRPAFGLTASPRKLHAQFLMRTPRLVGQPVPSPK
jgi:hypothetical protein